jgi:hypothetical protein
LLHLVGCLYYLYQWCTVKQISDNEIYLLIRYIKSVLWRVAKFLSYIEEARCLKVNSIFQSMPGSPKCSLSLRFPHQNPVYASTLYHTRYMLRPAYFLVFITWTILGGWCRSLSSSLCSFFHSPLRPKYSSQHPILKHSAYFPPLL